MSQVLYLDEARQHTLSAGPKNMIRLVPGRNVVEDEDFEAVMSAGTKEAPSRLKSMIDDGLIRVVGESVNIANVSAKEALDIIELEVSTSGLQDLLDQENSAKKTRKTLVKAIEDRIEAIKNAENMDPDENNQE